MGAPGAPPTGHRGSGCSSSRGGLSRPVLSLLHGPVLSWGGKACLLSSRHNGGTRGTANRDLRAPISSILHSHASVSGPLLLGDHSCGLLLGTLLGLLLLLLNLFGVTVGEEIRHDLPWVVAGDGATQAEHLTSQQPPHQTNGLLTLVVAWDSNIHMSQRGVSGGKGNDRDVDIGSLSHWPVVGAGVSHHQEAGLTVSSLDLVGECSRGEATSNRGGTSGRGKLEHSSLAVGTGRDDANISRVLNGSDGAGSQE